MGIDGFKASDKDAFRGYAPAIAKRFFHTVQQAGRRFDITVEGLDNIPRGRALLVGNHAFGWDTMFAMAAILEQLGRPVWVLGDHLWWKLPFVRRLAAAVGVVDGNQDNVVKLLEGDELVMVLPGGLREAVKPRELRYQLLWGHRYGFVHAAMRSRAPIVPVAVIGSDEMYDFVGNAFARGRRWLSLRNLPVPLPTRLLPRRVQISFRIGEAIPCPQGSDAHDFHAVRRLRREAEGALHELIELELARRCGIDLR
jgi:1-acyl-sn-glycerol-3-phosphate acyltransferase